MRRAQSKKTSRRADAESERFHEANIMKPISTDMTVPRTLRFNGTLSGASSQTSFTFGNILTTMLVASSTTATVTLFEVVKIKEVRVRVFCNGRVDLASAYTCTLTWQAGVTTSVMNDQRAISVSGMGVTPVLLRARPKKGSLASMYNYVSSNTAFNVFVEQTQSANAELCVVIELDLVFHTNESMIPVSANAGVGLTAGEWYYRGLDGLAAAGTAWPPMGVRNIA